MSIPQILAGPRQDAGPSRLFCKRRLRVDTGSSSSLTWEAPLPRDQRPDPRPCPNEPGAWALPSLSPPRLLCWTRQPAPSTAPLGGVPRGHQPCPGLAHASCAQRPGSQPPRKCGDKHPGGQEPPFSFVFLLFPLFLSLSFKLVINLYTINFGISATSRCTGQGHDAHSRPVAFRPLSPGLSIFPPDTLTA